MKNRVVVPVPVCRFRSLVNHHRGFVRQCAATACVGGFSAPGFLFPPAAAVSGGSAVAGFRLSSADPPGSGGSSAATVAAAAPSLALACPCGHELYRYGLRLQVPVKFRLS